MEVFFLLPDLGYWAQLDCGLQILLPTRLNELTLIIWAAAKSYQYVAQNTRLQIAEQIYKASCDRANA
jgi:hypothetical protein